MSLQDEKVPLCRSFSVQLQNLIIILQEGSTKNQEIVRGLLGKARTKLEKEEILHKKKMERLERNLYVKNLDSSVNDEMLKNNVQAIWLYSICQDNDRYFLGKSRGFGFVCFSTKEEAIRAKEEMNGILVKGNSLYVSFAQLKEVRQAKLNQKFGNRKVSDSGQKRVRMDQGWKSVPSKWGDSRMESQWYGDVKMEEVKEEKKIGTDQRNEWYENYFSDQTKADRRRNPGLKSVIVRPSTPEWIIQERRDQENRFKMTKKPKWGPPILDQPEGSKDRVASEEVLLKLTVSELFELKERMTNQEKVKVMLLGEKWTELFGGQEKLWQLCNAENISADIIAAKQKVRDWMCDDENCWGTSSGPPKEEKNCL